MKKVVLLALGILLVSLVGVIAIPNPSSTYCENMGYAYNGTHCVFPNNKSCEVWQFYNGSCGIEYIKNLSCAKAGESLEPGKLCCEGLIAISTIEYNKEEGICIPLVGAWHVCSSCGNGVCDEIENKCNCAADCGLPEINASIIRERARERIRQRLNMTLSRWQAINQSECVEGCVCAGEAMSCINQEGRTMMVKAGTAENVVIITIEKTNTTTTLEIRIEQGEGNRTRVYAKLSNGAYAEVKVMPDVASETALQRLRLRVCREENNCAIILKEVSQRERTQLAYELQAERHAKLLWLFSKKMQVKMQIDAENGEIIMVKKPWWAFLASEPEE